MKILVVEDEVKLGVAIKKGLEQDAYVVELVHDADDALSYAEGDTYDAMIFDRMLPEGKDGLDICKELRSKGNNTPILMLTARDAVEDRVDGLNGGADDYLIKPFSMLELKARVRALLRRPEQAQAPELRFGTIVMNTNTKQVTDSGRDVHLSKKEFALVEYLAAHAGAPIEKDTLINQVWGLDAEVLPNTVEVVIRNIRKKLGNNERYIQTVRGFGYVLQVE